MNAITESSDASVAEDDIQTTVTPDKLLSDIIKKSTDEQSTADETDDGDTGDQNGDGDTPEDEGPFPVEPDGGPGDGAGPPPSADESDEAPEDEGPFPVEPDGGPGDGAGPPSAGDGPFPVEPDGGIGDGAGPIPTDLGPFPVEPDGGIGDGAGPLPINVSDANKDTPSRGLVIATEAEETFYFVEDDHGGAIIGFDLEKDTLDLSLTATDFTSIEDVKASATELTHILTGEVFGITLDLGNGQVGYLAGLTMDDLDAATIIL